MSEKDRMEDQLDEIIITTSTTFFYIVIVKEFGHNNGVNLIWWLTQCLLSHGVMS